MADSLPLSMLAARWDRGLGHKQITGAYLLALAVHNNGCLVSFDAKMSKLAADGNVERDGLVILRA